MTGTDIVNYDAEWAADAKAAQAAEPPSGGTFLSTKGGVLTYGEQAMPGNQAAVIVIDSYRENSFYPGRYVEGQSSAPVCYAFGREEGDLAPWPGMQNHPEYFVPQAAACAGCQWNMWGTAETGKGKACQNRRRLSVLPAGFYTPRPGSRDFDLHLFDSPDHYASAEVAFLRTPVTSIKEWAKYVNQIATAVQRPPHGVLTRLYIEPDPKTQYRVRFEMLDVVPDFLARVIRQRHADQMQVPPQSYDPPDANQGQNGNLRRPPLSQQAAAAGPMQYQQPSPQQGYGQQNPPTYAPQPASGGWGNTGG